MRISELLSAKGTFVATVDPESTIRSVIAQLTERDLGALVVLDDGASIVGIVSERDVVRAIHRFGPTILDSPVRIIMSANVRTCSPQDEVESLARTMTEHRIRHVPVTEGGALVGIVSIGDVVKNRMDELEHDRDALVDYISAR